MNAVVTIISSLWINLNLLLAKIFFCCCGWGVFFLSLQRISRLALEWIKTKITWEYHWSVDLNRKTGKKHHEHGGLLCFIAVNSACVMTKELVSFWIKGSRFVLEPQTISWLLGPNMLSFVDWARPYCVLWLQLTCLCSTLKKDKKKEDVL